MSAPYRRGSKKAGESTVEAEYIYEDERGLPVLRVRRLTGKQFRQDRFEDGRWVPGLGGRKEWPLYRLKRVSAAVLRGATIYIVEGEKDVEAAEAAGGVATTNPGGAGKWRSSHSECLRGASVVIVWDADSAGEQHALAVAQSLRGVARSVSFARAKEGNDLSDHLAAGFELDELADEAPATEAGESHGLVGTVLAEVVERLRVHAEANGLKSPSRESDGKTWRACCPAHEDRTPSLSVAPGTKQPVVVCCHAGCDAAEVIAALGLTWQDVSAAGGGDEQEGKGESQAMFLVGLLRERYEFVRAPDGSPYAIPLQGPRIAIDLHGRTGHLRARLAREYLEIKKAPAQPTSMSTAIEVVIGDALLAEPVEIHLRSAKTSDALVVDLGERDGRVVIVKGGGWDLADAPPDGIVFRRTALTASLPEPARGGDVRLLRELINVGDDAWYLVLAFLVMAWRSDINVPILAFLGQQGSGKSTAARLVVQTVDPSPALLRQPPKDAEGWITAAAGSRVVGLDNLSSISGGLSDTLCRAVTGEGDVRRKLYSDGDLVVFNFRRAIVITSIDPGILRGDLGERLLPVDLPRLNGNRVTDRELEAKAAKSAPLILGGLLDVIAEVLENPVELDRLPRMADAAEVMAAMDQAFGTDALGAYKRARGAVVEKVIESDVVATALLEFMRGRREWVGTMAALYDELAIHVPDGAGRRQWPGNARVLSQRLARAIPDLESARGLLVARRDLGGRAVLTLSWKSPRRGVRQPRP